MEAIEKAKVEEFAARCHNQAKSLQEQLVTINRELVRMQGAAAACDYVLALDPVTIFEEDEVTDDDIADLASFTQREAIDVAVEAAP